MPRVYLSPSLQPHNVGVGKYGREPDRCRDVALTARKELMRHGVEVRVSPRSWIETENFKLPVAASNSWHADLHIPIHSNASSNPRTGGTLIFYMPGSTKGKRIATLMKQELDPVSPGKDWPLATKPVWYETSNAKAPVAYIELGFHTNPADALSILRNPDRYGKAIAHACLRYFGIKIIGEEPQTVTIKASRWAAIKAYVKKLQALLKK